MSFDVSFQAFDRGDARPHTAAEIAAVAELLEAVELAPEPEVGFCELTLADGAELKWYVDHFSGNDEPFDGGMFALRGLSATGAEFLARLLAASGCVILAASDPMPVLLSRAEQRADLPPELRDGDTSVVSVVRDGPALAAALGFALDRWSRYAAGIGQAHGDAPPGGAGG